MSKKTNLIWIDLEMTGLDPFKDRIIEIATIVTNQELETIAEGPCIAIHQEEKVLQAMDDWNTEHHSISGLWDRVIESDVSAREAEQLTIEFLQEHVDIHASPMCGNSICQDRRFLAKWMPQLENYFHYRQIDVSSIKELIRRWNPQLLNGFSKSGEHLALADIRESIKELQYYRQYLGEVGGQKKPPGFTGGL
ncbi:oligoribonuclease [Marinicella meishanensis]|uniref:oligoribonuclease n=1 Tax=Marinicella meishanensis TaxID=2873263 RepID=UPI001CBD1FD0|nr:oligoribonuclease [Marinicella sp. NBU2979]